ncbi:MAG: hypothetical protein KDI30_02010 [Pseudomonadales bacterium]|nr:hypothetical protein [Pseudomonadales bacterium]
MFIGFALVVLAIYLVLVEQLHNRRGVEGIRIIAAVAGSGLLLLLPAKVFLTLLLMKNKSK